MKIFVTGASGFIGSAVVRELLDAGHQVVALARSHANESALKSAGATVHRGSLEDLESLRSGAASSDGVIHLAFVHDFANFAAAAEKDQRAIETLGEALSGSDRPLIVTSGTLLVQRRGELAVETEPPIPAFPRKSEDAAHALANRGVRASVVRLSPSVHGDGDQGFVPMIINLSREKGKAAYIGEGANRWTGVHRLDAARLYRLALEKGTAGANYHGVGTGDEAIPFRKIAEVIGRKLGVPVVSQTEAEAADHFGWMSRFASIDGPASSAQTQKALGWKPEHVGLLQDIEHGAYFEVPAGKVR